MLTPRLILTIWSFAIVTSPMRAESTLTGLDRIDEFQHLFAQKRVGLVVNHTSLNKDGTHISDIFLEMPDVTVTALFGPEHGVRSQAADGELVSDDIDAAQSIPVYSLYGKTSKPTPDMLKNVDILVFDMQDIGARFYTFIWTMFYAMQSAAEQNIPIVVLDRPNPIGGKLEGPVLDRRFKSGIGRQPIPVRHGMTIGELAQLFNGEGGLGENVRADLTVIPMKNWHRAMWFDETGLPFAPPSPNMPNLETASVYPGLCLVEGTNVSEGRGTASPFLTFGAPWIDSEMLIKELTAVKIPGVAFEAIEFTPKTIPGKALHPKFENQRCFGARLSVTDRGALSAFMAGISVIKVIHDLYPQKFAFREDGYFDLLCGTDAVRELIQSGESVQAIKASWRAELGKFEKMRTKYLLYPGCKRDIE